MIELVYSGIDIKVDLKPGIYVFPCSSADGKTYLASILRNLGAKKRVTSYTFSDKDLFDVGVVLDSSKYDLVLLDRYDMYFGDGICEMQEFAGSGVVLIDCKFPSFQFPVGSCKLTMTADRIMISGERL